MTCVRNLAVMALVLLPGSVWAHPLPGESHDRVIVVRLLDGSRPGMMLLKIDYRLEVGEVTVLSRDMRDFIKDRKEHIVQFARKPLAFYAEYGRVYSEIIGRNLVVDINRRPVALQTGKLTQTLDDEKTGKPLGHLRCDFQFSCELPLNPNVENVLEVREANFADDADGKIFLSVVNESKVGISRMEAPNPDLYKRVSTERPLDFDARMRTLTVWLQGTHEYPEPAPAAKEHERPVRDHDDHDDAFVRLYRWLRETDAGLWLLLLAFAGLGGVHALTPGHGKTLVAAYLVGQNGTVWHALLLGLVTTLTHTFAVLIIALVLSCMPLSEEVRQAIRSGLGLLVGLMVACLGFWLLLQRLSGRADHIHIGGGHDHYHHGVPTAPAKAGQQLGLWGIIILGMNGGLIPCWDAVAILAMVVGSNEFWFALPALLAFSAGLAAVLVAIGILVVQVRDFAGSKWGEGRFVRALPLLSALFITGMGIYLSYTSLPRGSR